MSNFMKIRPVRAELFQRGRRDGQTYDEANNRFSQFVNAPKRLTFITDARNCHKAEFRFTFVTPITCCTLCLAFLSVACFTLSKV